jgi:hypothetical protein
MHADSLDNVIKRLTSPPMNVSRVYIPLMNNALHVQRVELPQEKEGLSFGRRVRTVWEIEEFDQYREMAVWNPRTDTFETWFEDSYLLEKIAEGSGQTKQDLLMELDARTRYLTEIVKEGVREQKQVAEKILAYYTKKRDKTGENGSPKVRKSTKEKNQIWVREPGKRLRDQNKDRELKPDDSEQKSDSEAKSKLGRAASLGSRGQDSQPSEEEPVAEKVG